MIKITRFLTESRDELRKVVWPTRHSLFKLSAIVIIVAFVIGFYLSGLDALFGQGVQMLIR